MGATAVQQERLARAHAMYEQYGRSLEAEHWGEYLVVNEQGETILGTALDEVMERAEVAIAPGGFVFKLGESAVGRGGFTPPRRSGGEPPRGYPARARRG